MSKNSSAVENRGAGPAQPSPWAQARNHRTTPADKRNAVLSTAAQLFNERGYHATSLDDIASLLQVSKPTLYYYFSSKDDILLGCVRKGLDLMRQGIESTRAAGGDSVQQLRACMQVYADIVMQPFGMCLIRVGDQDLSPASRKKLRRVKADIDYAFRSLVAQCVDDGRLRPCDPKITAFAIAGALSWIGRWYRPDGAKSAEQISHETIETLLNGLLAVPSPAASRPAPGSGATSG